MPGQVDILIGSGLFFKLIKSGHLNLDDHLPAQIQLGCIVSGLIPTSHVNIGRALCAMVNDENVSNYLKIFGILIPTTKERHSNIPQKMLVLRISWRRIDETKTVDL